MKTKTEMIIEPAIVTVVFGLFTLLLGLIAYFLRDIHQVIKDLKLTVNNLNITLVKFDGQLTGHEARIKKLERDNEAQERKINEVREMILTRKKA